MRHGVMTTVEGSRLITALGDMRKSSELAVVEERLIALEAKLDKRK
jgi:hypothetical protein